MGAGFGRGWPWRGPASLTRGLNVQTDQLKDVMVAAVTRAGYLCEGVRKTLLPESARTKDDRSPVTVADLGAQAVVRRALSESFADVPVLGEEDASMLEDSAFAKIVGEAVTLGGVSMDLGELRRALAPDEGAATAPRRFVLDPIDGTKGYLRGDQYAVALALLEGDQVVAGVLGCPALGPGDAGIVAWASRGGGTWQAPLLTDDRSWGQVAVTGTTDASALRLVESVESGHSSHDHAAQVKQTLGIVADPVRIDSQCKYAVVARGDAEVYLRLPTRPGYREKVWDHAAGYICVAEAGGRITDARGAPLDFSQGAHLDNNRGVIATHGPLHDRVLEAVAAALSSD